MLPSALVSASRQTMLLAALLLLIQSLALPATGAPQAPKGESPPAELALVPPDALFFVHLHASALWQTEVGKQARQLIVKELGEMHQQIEKRLGLTLDDVERVTVFMASIKDREPMLMLTTRKPLARERLLTAILPGAEEQQYKGKAYFTAKEGDRRALHFVNDRTVLTGQVEDVVQLFKRLGRSRGEGLLSPALRKVDGTNHLVAGLVVPEEVVDKLQKEAEKSLENNPLESALLLTLQPLLEAQVATATVQLSATLDLKLQLTFANDKAAKEAHGPAQDLLAVGRMLLRTVTQRISRERGVEPLVAILKDAEHALQNAKVETTGVHVQASAAFKADTAIAGRSVMEAARRIQLANERMRSANNLKQIALAMHNYESTYGHFPHDLTDKDGKPLLSWRVTILPFIEQDNLHQQFRLDEPWDSPHNKALLKHLPPIYAPVAGAGKDQGLTYYQGFVGKHTLFEGKAAARLADITDGTSNTLMVVEAGEPVLWTKPDDLPYDPKKPLPKLGGMFTAGFHAAFCDGSVRFLPKTIDEMTLRALITRDGGEVVDIDKVR